MTTIFEAIKFIENIVDSEKCFGIAVTKFKDGTMRFSYTHTQEHLAEWTDGKIVDGVVTLATAKVLAPDHGFNSERKTERG